MTEIEKNPSAARPGRNPSAAQPNPRGVIDPAWEDELRRGQTAEGEAGSVEAELALLHLFRHVREPESLAPEQLDSLWSAIEAEVAPASTAWWRKTWLWWTAPGLAAVAVLAVIVLDGPATSEAPTVARSDERKSERAQAPTAAPAPAPSAAARDEKFAAEAVLDDQAIAGGVSTRKGGANGFETSFKELAPYGRRALRGSVDSSLDDLRGQLLADARGASQ